MIGYAVTDGGILRAGALVEGKVLIGRGGHFEGAARAGANNIDRATAKGISDFEKGDAVYFANDSISLPKALTVAEFQIVQQALSPKLF